MRFYSETIAGLSGLVIAVALWAIFRKIHGYSIGFVCLFPVFSALYSKVAAALPASLSAVINAGSSGLLPVQSGFLPPHSNSVSNFRKSGRFVSLVLAFLLLAGYVQAATITSTGTGGVWTAGSSWLGGVAPGANDDVIIAAGTTVTIDAAAVVNNLTINNGGTLIVSGTNTLTVNGSWTNNGIFTANSSTVVLGGSTDVSFSGNSPSTFYNLTVSKTNGLEDIIDFTSAGTVSCSQTLTLTSGLLKLTSGTVNLNCGNFSISEPAGIWVDGATLSTTDLTITNGGLIRISSGIVNFGTESGNSVHTQINGAFEVTGGNVFIAGRLENTAGGTVASGIPSGLNISGGTITIGTVGNGLSSAGTLDVSTQGAFNFTGGTIVFQYSSTAITPLDVALVLGSGSGVKNTVGGTFQFGNELTPAGTLFRIDSEIPIDNLTLTEKASALVVGHDLTISNVLTMNGGNIDAATNSKKVILKDPDINSISRTSGAIIGSMERAIGNTGGTAYLFPVGNGTDYTPLLLNFSGANSRGRITVSSQPRTSGDFSGSLLSTTSCLNNYWTYENQEVNFSSISADFTSPADLTANYKVGIYNNSTSGWSYPDVSYTLPRIIRFTADQLNSSVSFILAECTPPTPAISDGNKTICATDVIPALSVKVGTGETADWYAAGIGGTALAVGTTSYTPIVAGTYYVEARNTATNCTSLTRTEVSIIINQVTPGSISGSQPVVCYGDNLAVLTSITDGVGSAPVTYRWEKSTDQSNWTIIPLANSSTYDPPGPLNTTSYYRRRTISTFNGLECSALSNEVRIIVQQQISGTIGADQTICEGDTPQLLTGNLVVPGPEAVISYQWESSVNGNLPWTAIAGATGQNYQPSALNNDMFYRRVVTSTVDSKQCQSVSNVIRIFVNNLSPGAIVGSQGICLGATPGLISSINPATGDGTITYIWQSSTNFAGPYSNISPAVTSADYLPPTPSVNTWYRRVATSLLNGKTCSKSVTHALVVGGFSPGTITSSDADLLYCIGENPGVINGTDQRNAYSSPISFKRYRWQRSADGISWTDIPSSDLWQNYDPPVITQTTHFRRIVVADLNGTECERPSEAVVLTAYPVPVLEDIPVIETCEGSPFVITASGGNTITGTPTFKLTYISGTYPAGAEPVEQVNSNGSFAILPLQPPYNPVIGQQNFRVTLINGDGGACQTSKNVTVKIYDVPDITLAASCASTGNNGTIYMTGSVTYPAGAVVEYSIDNGATWQTGQYFYNLPIGSYTVLARSRDNNRYYSCLTSLTGEVDTRTAIASSYEICQGGVVNPGVTASSLCIQWQNYKPNLVGQACTTPAQKYYMSASNTSPYIQGSLVQYKEVTLFTTETSGSILVKDCPNINGSYSIYEYPFNATRPADRFIKKINNSCNGLDPAGLSIGVVYVLVLNSPSENTSVCTKLQSVTGDKMQIQRTIGEISWYTTPEGGTPIGTGSPFNPVGVPGSGITNTNTPGTWTFYAGCGMGECREPAFFTIHPTPTGEQAEYKICTGSKTNIALVSRNDLGAVIDPAKVTYTWTASVIRGTASGFSDCVTGCGGTIEQTITSLDNNICPIIRYRVIPSVGGCPGQPFNVDVLVINDNLIRLVDSTPEPALTAAYSCLEDVPVGSPLIGVHICLETLTSTVEDTNNGGTGCPQAPLVITRKWSFEMPCGDVVFTQEITVSDDTHPSFTVPEDKTVYLTDLCNYNVGVGVTGDVNDEADNCTLPANFGALYTDVVNPGTCLGEKIITRTWVLIDACGNETKHQQHITVKDETPPTISCNLTSPYEVYVDDGKNYATLTLPAPTYSDNSQLCNPKGTVDLKWKLVNGSQTLTDSGTIPAGYRFAVGPNNITYTATDDCGNFAICEVTVVVLDPPVLICPVPNPLQLDTDNDQCSAEITPASPTLYSGTQPITWEWSVTGPGSTSADSQGTFVGSDSDPGPPSIGNYQFRLGTTIIRWRAENKYGYDECTQTVIVTDKQPPTFTLPDELSYCVNDIISAVYNANPSPLIIPEYDDLTTPRPEYYKLTAASKLLDLDPIRNNFKDNCCDDNLLELHWKVDFVSTPNPATVAHEPIMETAIPDQSGQPSAYGDILFPGDGVTFTDVVHRIYYWLVDCNGNRSEEKVVYITIKPRPNIIKMN